MFSRAISYREPLAAFQVFAANPHAVFLDSANPSELYSVIASNPFRVITATHDGVAIDGCNVAGNPFDVLEQEWGKYVAGNNVQLPFIPGVFGFIGYELAGCLERLPKPKEDVLNLPRMSLGLYDTIAVFDQRAHRAWIVSFKENRGEILAAQLAQAPDTLPPLDWAKTGGWQSELGRREVEHHIRQVIEYIHAGDIFQANYTQRFMAARPTGLSDFDIYRRLRTLSPSPFAAFLRSGNVAIASASPERFIKLHRSGRVEAHPIKGTRPRYTDPILDEKMAEELRNSPKDRAENLMIVDLMRSDLARVCELGSIRVPRLCALESFASVHHLVSTVEGQIRKGLGPIDLLRAAFPGGSITGAPKIRAMEIIHALESSPRGVYCGCLGWIGFDGSMDMSMVIRTLTMTSDTILAQAGGGIVADSDASAEYEESMIKLDPLLRAVDREKQ
jgi:para-aminobenzoate synthetase component 1